MKKRKTEGKYIAKHKEGDTAKSSIIPLCSLVGNTVQVCTSPI